MNKKLIFAVTSLAAMTLIGCSNYTRRPYTEIPLAEGEEVSAPSEFCAFEDFPTDVPFKYIHAVKVGKGTFGSAESLRPYIKERVERRGGNAVANYHENQRFGFFLWRLVRPVASGDAISILNSRGKSCEEMGGWTLTK